MDSIFLFLFSISLFGISSMPAQICSFNPTGKPFLPIYASLNAWWLEWGDATPMILIIKSLLHLCPHSAQPDSKCLSTSKSDNDFLPQLCSFNLTGKPPDKSNLPHLRLTRCMMAWMGRRHTLWPGVQCLSVSQASKWATPPQKPDISGFPHKAISL